MLSHYSYIHQCANHTFFQHYYHPRHPHQPHLQYIMLTYRHLLHFMNKYLKIQQIVSYSDFINTILFDVMPKVSANY